MVLKASTLIALLLLALPVCAQDTPAPGTPMHVICDSGCGSGGVGASVDISSVAGNIIVGGDVPVTFTVPQHVIIDSMPAGGAGLTDAELRAADVSVNVTNATLAVTGTFWQATQPISHANLDVALSTLATSAKQPVLVSGRVPVDGSGVTQPVSGTFWQATQPVSGTFWQATQPVSFTQPALVAGSALIGKVGIDQTTPGTTNRVDVGTFPDNEPINVAQVGGTATVSGGLAGSQAIGGTAANNAAINQNPVLVGCEAVTPHGTQPTAATEGNQRRCLETTDGRIFVAPHGPVTFTCGLQGIAATLTQCQAAAAAGLRYHITGVFVQTTTTTSGTYAIQTGTGTNCGTGTAALFPVSGTSNRFNAPITTSAMAGLAFYTPLVAPVAAAICVIGVATNTISIQINGYTAP